MGSPAKKERERQRLRNRRTERDMKRKNPGLSRHSKQGQNVSTIPTEFGNLKEPNINHFIDTLKDTLIRKAYVGESK